MGMQSQNFVTFEAIQNQVPGKVNNYGAYWSE